MRMYISAKEGENAEFKLDYDFNCAFDMSEL